MSTSVKAVHEYEYPVEKVFEAFTDPDFYIAKFEGIGHRDVAVTSSSDADDVFTVETSRQVPLQVPGPLKALLGSWTTVIQDEEWIVGDESDFLNELDIASDGVPARMTGKMVLYPVEDGGCVNEVTITIDCGIPLLGGKLEQFVANTTSEQLDAEYGFIQEYLDSLG